METRQRKDSVSPAGREATRDGRRIAPSAGEGVRPIFIVGAPRSGTSILTWALGQHPNIQPMPETVWIAVLATGAFLAHEVGSARGRFSHLSNVEYPLEPFLQRLGVAVHAITADVFEERCRRLYGEHGAADARTTAPADTPEQLQIRRHVDDPKHRWVDGTPYNTQFLWPIATMFPRARFLHNLRRPDEVIASLESFDAVGAQSQALAEGIATWVQHAENAWLAERALGAQRIHRVDFERLNGNPEELCRDVLQFLGEEFHPDCLSPFGRRINSSRAEAKLDSVRSRLSRIPAFRNAMELYERIARSPVPTESEEDAMAILRRRFVDYAHDRGPL